MGELIPRPAYYDPGMTHEMVDIELRSETKLTAKRMIGLRPKPTQSYDSCRSGFHEDKGVSKKLIGKVCGASWRDDRDPP